jgi:uncharacterized membrane protein YidH (DUF202 family)
MQYVFNLLRKFNELILNPVIVGMFALAVLLFIYGVFKYVKNSDSDEERATGRRHMVWGVVGMFIMISVFGIIQVILNTVGAPRTDINQVIRIP